MATEKFKDILKSRREALRLTMAELAEKTGLSRGYINNLEKGEREPTDESLKKLAPAISVHLEYLKAIVAAEKLGDDGIHGIIRYVIPHIDQYRSLKSDFKSILDELSEYLKVAFGDKFESVTATLNDPASSATALRLAREYLINLLYQDNYETIAISAALQIFVPPDIESVPLESRLQIDKSKFWLKAFLEPTPDFENLASILESASNSKLNKLVKAGSSVFSNKCALSEIPYIDRILSSDIKLESADKISIPTHASNLGDFVTKVHSTSLSDLNIGSDDHIIVRLRRGEDIDEKIVIGIASTGTWQGDEQYRTVIGMVQTSADDGYIIPISKNKWNHPIPLAHVTVLGIVVHAFRRELNFEYDTLE